MSASWFCLLFYKDYQLSRLKQNITHAWFILNQHHNASKLQNFDDKHFVEEIMDFSESECLFSIQFCTHVLISIQELSPKTPTDVANVINVLVDEWWNNLKCILRQRYLQLSINKHHFIHECIPSHTNQKQWSVIDPLLRNLTDSKATCLMVVDAFIHSITSRVYDLQIHAICFMYYYDPMFEVHHDYNSIIHDIRLCVDNNITHTQSVSFSEWLLSLLMDEQLFQIKLDSIHKYIIDEDIDAAKFTVITRKRWANSFAELNIPRGISTKIHKHLRNKIQEKERKKWGCRDIAEFSKMVLRNIQILQKNTIMDNLQEEKIETNEFIQRYISKDTSTAIQRVQEFVRKTVSKSSKKMQIMSHRIVLCVALYDNISGYHTNVRCCANK